MNWAVDPAHLHIRFTVRHMTNDNYTEESLCYLEADL